MAKFWIVMVVICACRIAWGVENDRWKPAAGRLMTRWAKDVSPANVVPEYPRPQMVRKEWVNLNGLWEFASGDEVKEAPVGKTLSGRILVPFCMESALSGVGKHVADRVWYRRMVEVPKGWGGKRVLLNFGAVDYETAVWVNGKQVGTHRGGYDAFSFDITDALKTDGSMQEIVVGVTDATAETQARGKQITDPHGIFYTPVTGIWQTVWMEPAPKMYAQAMKIETDIGSGEVDIHVGCNNLFGLSIPVEAEVSLDGQVVASGVLHFGGSPPAIAGGAITIPKDELKLWSPDTPVLYDLKLKIKGDDGGVDEISSYFGIRKIEVSPDEKGVPRIKLNAKVVMQVGPLDQGFWPDGIYTAPTDEALKFDLEMTKRLGFNCIRKHVKVEPQRWYYWADRLGFLVWQDMPSAFGKESGEWQAQFQKELRALVEQHINSPAIVMWVPINEGWGQSAFGTEGTKNLADLMKRIDPTRLVNNASGWTDAGAGDVHDIHAYPNPAAPPIEKTRAIVLGEFGGLGLGVDGHTWTDKHWGYQGMNSQAELTDHYVRLLGRLWQLMENDGLCAGIYTQITDVETETNGLMTYDREVLKVDEARIRQANQGHGPRVDISPLVKTAKEEPAEWKYTFEKPASDEWFSAGFDDSSWKTGKSGFGTPGTPGAVVNTTWSTPDIWLRRDIDIPGDALKDVQLFVHHDEGCEIYINGVLARKLAGFTTDYTEQSLRQDAHKALKPGKNLVAVHCNQTIGGQYIDVGFVKLVETARK